MKTQLVIAATVLASLTGCVGGFDGPEQASNTVWQNTYSPDVPYYNVSGAAVAAYAAPSAQGGVVGTVMPDDGGFVRNCNASLDWCQISFDRLDETAWVDMRAFGGTSG